MSTISQDCGYPDPNCAPSSPDAAVVSRMCRTLLNPLGVALESALVSLVPEDDGKLRYEPAAASPPAGSASCDRKRTKLGHTVKVRVVMKLVTMRRVDSRLKLMIK